MKIFKLAPVCIVFILSCSQIPETEKDLRAALNAKLNIKLFDTAIYRDSEISFQQFRETHNFVSVVYLQEGCQPCYPKYIEWHEKMEEIGYSPDYTVLFVIQTEWPDVFFSKIAELSSDLDEKFFIVLDPEHKYTIANNHIPRWIIDASVLIDSENKIKMVGAPWLNEDMTQLFYACANSQAGDTEGAEAARLSHLAPSTTEVGVVQVVRGDFELELISNGTLEE